MVEITLAILVAGLVVWNLWISRRGLPLSPQFQQLAQDWAAEREALRKEVAGLRTQLERLLARGPNGKPGAITVEEERDCYLQALHALLRQDVRFTEEDYREIVANPISLDEIIEQLKQPQKAAP